MTDLAPPNSTDSAMRAVLVNPLSEPADQTQFRRSLAVVVGIDAYGHGIPPLRTAVNDATRLAELLAASHGYETILLTGQESGELVSGERLRSLFSAELPARLGEDDRLLLYFAGHGVALDGDDGPAGYLVPQDARPDEPASMLSMVELHGWLAALPCRHLLAILDCCFAGAFRWASTRHIGALPEKIYREHFERYLRSPAWQVLTSAAYDQKALDLLGNRLGRREAGDRHSPFAQALIEALERGSADLVPRGQGDGVITATELYLYLREQVEVQAEAQASHQQTPGLWPLKKHRKGEFIFLAPGRALNLDTADALTKGDNPYPGLNSYDFNQHDTQLFFGREDEIRELAALVDRQAFIAVLGASGTGKSSLVKAGLLPRLQEHSGKLQVAGGEGSAPYHVLAPIRPTDQPLRSLAALLRAKLDADPSGFGNPKGLARDDRALAEVVARWAQAHPGQRLVLTIDQFEELATLCRDDAEREHFLRLLAIAVEQQPDTLRLIITLRTDFEPQFTQAGSPLAQLWQAGRFVVPPMDIEDLRQVIEGPASVRVLYFEPSELVDDLIREVVQTPGALPLLSFTLSELYVKYVQSGRDDRALSGADYKALGGVVGSLRNRATEEYDHLPDKQHKDTMRRVMLRMVAMEGGELARRRVALSELEYPTDEENARVQTVRDRLVAARLLVLGTGDNSDGTKGEAYVEPAHDALVLAWDKLLCWKKEAEEYLSLQRRLAQAASEWSKAQPEAKSGLLWDDDPRLPLLEKTLWPTGGKQQGLRGLIRWAGQVLAPKRDAPVDITWVNGTELAFVRASVLARSVFWRRAVAITTAVIVLLAALATFALVQRGAAITNAEEAGRQKETAVANEKIAREKQAVAEREARRAQAGELAVHAQNAIANYKNDPSLALLLAIQAVEVTWYAPEHMVTINAEAALRDAIDAAPPYCMTLHREPLNDWINSAAFNPDGMQIVTAGADGLAYFWNADTGEGISRIHAHSDGVEAAAYSPDGSQIITTGCDRANNYGVCQESSVRVLDAGTGEMIQQLSGHVGPVRSVAWSPSGSQIVTAGADRTARIWDAATGQELRQLNHPAEVNSAAYSPDSKRIVTASGDRYSDENNACIWDATTGERLLTLKSHPRGVQSAVFSPDGLWIATGGCDLFENGGSCQQGSVRIWDAITGKELSGISPLSGHTAGVNTVAFSPDGTRIVTASGGGYSEDNSARIWDAATGQQLLTLSGHTSGVRSAAYSPDGRKIVTSSADGTARIWNARSNEDRRKLIGHSDSIVSAVYSPDGRRIVTASGDGTARIWDAATGQEVPGISPLNVDSPGVIFSAEYALDGQQVVTTGDYGPIRIWDTTTGQEIPNANPVSSGTSRVDPMVHSPDARQIITFGEDAHVLDAFTGLELYPLIGHTDRIRSADYSPDGRQIVTASDDHTVRIWDSTTGKELQGVSPLRGHTDIVWSAVYSPDGRQIVTASSDQTARIWDVTTGQELRRLSGHQGPLMSAVYSPDGRRIVTAGADNTARIWLNIDDLLEEAASLIQRDPPLLTPEERQRYGLE